MKPLTLYCQYYCECNIIREKYNRLTCLYHFMCCLLCFQASKWSSEEWAVTRSFRVAITLDIRAHNSTERTHSDGFARRMWKLISRHLDSQKSHIFQLDSASTQTWTQQIKVNVFRYPCVNSWNPNMINCERRKLVLHNLSLHIRRSLSRYSSLADSDHGVCLFVCFFSCTYKLTKWITWRIHVYIDQSSWLQIRRPRFDSRHYQIFWRKKKENSSGYTTWTTGSTQPREHNWGATW
jgi:hypothetical protein